MSWNTELAYFVTPKSGPMRAMRTLVDVNRALLDDLPFVSRLRPHWAAVARLLLIASDTGSTIDVRLATDALVRALETEGWMTRARGPVVPSSPDAATSPAVVVPVSSSRPFAAETMTAAVPARGAAPMAIGVEVCRDGAAEGRPAPPAAIDGPPLVRAPVFGAPGYRPGEVVDTTARALDDADDLSGLILRKLPAGPERAADRGPDRVVAPDEVAASLQGRGTRRPADTKL